MEAKAQPHNLKELLDRIEQADNGEVKISLSQVLDHVGHRSYSPFLVVAGILLGAPGISDIPGVPTTIGVFVLLISIQMLIRKRHIWLPQWLLNSEVKAEKVSKAISWVRRPSRFIDRFLHSRLEYLTGGTATTLIAVDCILIASCLPMTEIVPFVSYGFGIALICLGLSLMANDGILVVLSLAISIGAFWIAGYYLM